MERLVNSLMMHGRNNGRYFLSAHLLLNPQYFPLKKRNWCNFLLNDTILALAVMSPFKIINFFAIDPVIRNKNFY